MRKLIIGALSASLALAACGSPTVDSTKEKQADKAAAAAAAINFTENAEINNISRKLKLTSQPGIVGYIVLLNQAGQPILYTTVRGKVTSSGKRLTPPVKFWSTYEAGLVADAPSDEGTWGSSDPYIYFWDTNDVYHQWSGSYLYSDKPIRLRVEPLIIASAT